MLYKKLFRYAILILSWLSLTATYFYFGHSLAVTSDGVANILEARAIINGNIFLHGWTLSPDTFYTLDTLLDVFLMIIGLHLITINYLTPAIIYSSLVCITYYAAKVASKNMSISLLSTAVFLAFPITKYIVLFTQPHLMTTLFIVSTFLLYSSRFIRFKYLLSFFLLFLAVTGDPYALFVGVLPIIAYSTLMIFIEYYNNTNKKNSHYIKMITSSIAAAILAKLTVYLIGAEGGYHFIPNQLMFVQFDKLGNNIKLFIESILVVMQSDFFGQNIFSYKTITEMIHAALFILFSVFAFIHIKMTALKDNSDIVNLSLFSIFATCLAFVFSTQPVDIFTSRYLLDILFFVTILFSYLSTIYYKKISYVLFFSSLLIMSYFIYESTNAPHNKNKNYIKVIKFLEKRKLTYGLADYWNAAPFTFLSNSVVKVRQVVTNSDGLITPYAWLSDSRWYKNITHPQFLIVGKSGNVDIKSSVAIKNYGPPKQIQVIAGYKIFIYTSASDVINHTDPSQIPR